MVPTALSIRDVLRFAENLMAAGDFVIARSILEYSILTVPNESRLHWQLGVCLVSSNRFHLAHDCFREAVRLNPTLAPAHACLASWYLNHGLVDLALQSSTTAVELAPANAQIALMHARILEAAGQLGEAWMIASQLVEKQANHPGIVRLYGRMARYRNQQPAALAMTMRLLEASTISDSERAGLHFTAADLLDSLDRFDEAFAAAAAGNAIARPHYDPAAHERTFDRFIDYFTAERIRELARAVPMPFEISAIPVFIVGMPRSGTSLVEQILASHSDVHGAGELDFMQHLFHGTVAMLGAKADDYPRCLDRLTTDQATGLGQVYLQPLTAISPASRYITDKVPLNFLHLGLINLLLPGARIIHCRREPMATGLSCYMNAFKSGHDFKYDLTNLGRFHRQYQRLMHHWSTEIDLPMLDVNYEDLVADLEGQTRRLLHFLELPYSQACVDFHRNGRAVLTSSLQQVRQPVYTGAVQRWKHYEKHLEPLKKTLAEPCTRLQRKA